MKFFLFLILLITNFAHAGEFKTLESGFGWNTLPAVFVCENSGIQKEKVKQAIDFWNSKGYRLKEDPVYKRCDGETKYGQITIDTFKQGENLENKNGNASLYSFSGTKNYYCVEIKLNKNLANELELIKHELGHAIGLDDDPTGYLEVMIHQRDYH